MAPTETVAAVVCQPGSPDSCSLRDWADHRGLLVGTAVQPGLLGDEPRYAQTVAMEFNSITPENAFKWPATEPEAGVYTWDGADSVAQTATENGQGIRGHTLVWPNTFSSGLYEILPAYVLDAPDGETMQRYIDEHIAAVVGRYADVTDRWDVVNEVISTDGSGLDPNVLTETLGEEWIVRAFTLTREFDPDADLYINDYGTANPGPKHDAMVALVDRLLEAGAPVDGVGIQGHFVVGQPDAAGLASVMADWEARGMKVALTEVDVVNNDGPEAQAGNYADLIATCLASPACVELTTWGVDDAHTWVTAVFGEQSGPLLFDESYEPKPAYDALIGVLAEADG